MPSIRSRAATQEAMAPYGSVVKSPSGAPTSQGPGYRFYADLAHYLIDGETEIGICSVFEVPDPVVSAVERHLRTPEILIPIDGPFLLPLVRQQEDEEIVEAFRVEVGEAVVIDAGVWHGPCVPVGQAQESYFVVFRRDTPREDVQTKAVSPVRID